MTKIKVTNPVEDALALISKSFGIPKENKGVQIPVRFIKEVAATNPSDELCRELTGMSPQDYQAKFKRSWCE